MWDFTIHYWPEILSALTIALSALTSVHAIFNKEDSISAVAWVGLIWLVPVFGSILYLMLGINRIKRRAKVLRGEQPWTGARTGYRAGAGYPDQKTGLDEQFRALSELVRRIVQKPLLPGNRVIPLMNGDNAYPAMLKAIDEAETSINLSTYIFDNDNSGNTFLEALERAVSRGVEVRVIVDDMGARYSRRPITTKMKRAGIKVARFLPTLLPSKMPFLNLRNHRKILVIDGKTGFTGGMNIRDGHVIGGKPSHPVQDLHFMIEGPVVAHLQEAFLEDWAFCTGERLDGEIWFPEISPRGSILARGIPDGPDEDFGKLLWTFHGALACAKSSIRIVTPYFVPDSSLITSLNIAVMRGVRVEIILPRTNNLPMVKWASTEILPQLLEHGCTVYLTSPPFDHTKLMIIDSAWTLFGSGNWDARSLKLNFEFNVECYDTTLAEELDALILEKLTNAEQVTLEGLRNRSFPVRLRDGIARLFSPYL
jgi:cardiolipin synthase